MKHNFPFLITFICLIISLSVNLYQFQMHQDKLIKNNASLKKNNDLISMMIQGEDGRYIENKDNSWPKGIYKLNEDLSGCENGSKITWDKENNNVKVDAASSDKCYAYFELLTISEYILNLYTKDGENNLYYHDGIGNYLNSNLEAGDLSYRYSGSSESVKNYVCLDGKTKENACSSDADLYQIIGLFKNEENEQYEMKLIKYNYAAKEELGDNDTASGGAYNGYYSYPKDNYKGNNAEDIAIYYWNSSKGTGINNTNMWQYSNLNKINLNQFYLSYITNKVSDLENHIMEHTWITGGVPYSNTENVQQAYNSELGSEKITTNDLKCYAKDNNQTAILCTDADLTYLAKIGLMYVSDYGYAAYSDAWSKKIGGYNKTDYDSDIVKTNNWMYRGLYDWMISRGAERGDYARFTNVDGWADSYGVNSAAGVRPAFYLDASTKLASGDGSKTNPYRLNLTIKSD